MDDYLSLQDYPSQLKSPEWRIRRMEILERDEHACKICGKRKSLVFYNEDGENISVGEDHHYPYINKKDILFTHFSIKNFTINTILAEELSLLPHSDYVISSNGILGILAQQKTNTFPVKDDVEINFVKHPTGMLYFIINKKGDNLDNIKIHVPYYSEHPLVLNVHHKRYIIGHKAWEYDDEDLVTLCNECHTKIHKAIGAPVYSDENGYMKEVHLTPCYRCGGTGYFPEYKHVENGICFRCRGVRFEELIR